MNTVHMALMGYFIVFSLWPNRPNLEFLLRGTIVPLNFFAGYYCSIVASTPQPTVYAFTPTHPTHTHIVYHLTPIIHYKKIETYWDLFHRSIICTIGLFLHLTVWPWEGLTCGNSSGFFHALLLFVEDPIIKPLGTHDRPKQTQA